MTIDTKGWVRLQGADHSLNVQEAWYLWDRFSVAKSKAPISDIPNIYDSLGRKPKV